MQVEYLRKRTNARLSPMKHIIPLSEGTNCYALKTLYLHEMKTMVMYSTSTLANLRHTDLQSGGGSRQCAYIGIWGVNVDEDMHSSDGT